MNEFFMLSGMPKVGILALNGVRIPRVEWIALICQLLGLLVST